MKNLEQIKAMKVSARMAEVDYIKKLIFYTKRAEDETKAEIMNLQLQRLKEFLKLIGFRK